MSQNNVTMHDTFTLGAIQEHFAAALPELTERIAFNLRGIHPPDRREELIQNALALAWKTVLSLAKRGKDYREFWSAVALRSAQASRAGRSIAGQEARGDCMSPQSQAKHDYRREPMPRDTVRPEDDYGSKFAAIADHDKPADTATLFADLPGWLNRLNRTQRKVLFLTLDDERTKDIARRCNLSCGRVSQLRAGLVDSWVSFTE